MKLKILFWTIALNVLTGCSVYLDLTDAHF